MAEERSLKTLVFAVYVLQAIGFVSGITWIVGVTINYVKRPEAAGTWLESHFNWQIRTFWWGLLWGALGALLTLVLIGYVIWAAAAIWVIYRIVKGMLYLNDAKPLL